VTGLPSLAWSVFLGLFYVNLTTVLLGLFVLVLALVERLRVKKRTPFLEISLLLLILGFLFLTLHGDILLLIFPISSPEQPMLDNNLTFNFSLTNLLVYLVFPVLLLILLKSDVSREKLGFKVSNPRRTAILASLGLVFNVLVFLVSYAFFGYRWVSGYTVESFVLWISLVTILSVFLQVVFYLGILFNKYLNHEYVIPLAIISLLAYMSWNSLPLPWLVSNLVLQSAKLVVTWKTRNIYGATLMSVGPALLDVLTQFM
jgi:hypothetical protein